MKDIVVLLATYNGSEYLKQQLDSLFKQTFSDFRIVVHDDGSSDATLDIINTYRNNYPEKIELLYGDSLGSPKANFLWMLTQVEAEIYFFCDQDDVWHETKIEKSLHALGKINTPACVFTDMWVTDESLNVLSDSFIRYIGRTPDNTAYSQILIDNPAAGTTMCFNRALRDLVVELLPEIDINNIPMHDALVLALADIMGQVIAIDEPLVYYRQTGHNTMGATTETDSDKRNRNVADLKDGSIFAKKKAFVMEARLFAAELSKADFIPVDKKNILIRFAEIGRKSKIKRMSFYKKNNFTRAHHNVWFRLWV
ncbi:MAG: glycosyltransferase family 2 protein [Pseudobutyrivibrio sp.]|uniref:glycosyltransferase family 2 protein n=1 Tax=Pseudobutyrivibrio sp. TaxID=2014367 RepID=UPI0025EEBCF9|nr:glycosyltransferase family 2 protein [Pseudobutyrivibrio sp.]MBQ8488635.1 glycosyltransferase family 2 protein [Pseudobutyrivibrio sp.]